MYCPSCGAESSRDLNYCSRCGASTAPPAALVPIDLTKPTLAIGLTVALITLGGFALLITGAVKLAEIFHNPDPTFAIIVVGMMTIAFCDLMLIRLLGKIVKASLEEKKGNPAMVPRMQPRESPKQLNPQQYHPVASVTEHTTRTFSPIKRETSDHGNQ